MAFSKGTDTSKEVQFKKYVGVGSVLIKGVNPTKAELDAFYGGADVKEPVYIGETEIDGKKYQQIRIDFIVQADEKYGFDFKTKVAFFLVNKARVGSNSGKVQIIDKYGRTAYATPEEFKAKAIPQYSNGPANIDPDYRAAFVGEEELTNFLITFMGIPSPMKYVEGKWYLKDAEALKDCEARLDRISSYFNGDVSELRDIISVNPNNHVKVLFGIKTDANGNQFVTPYTRMFVRNNVTDYKKLQGDVDSAKNAGAYSNVEFEVSDLHEYAVTPTDLSKPVEVVGNPFGPAPEDNPFS